MGFEPTTSTLATWRSTTELRPRASKYDTKGGEMLKGFFGGDAAGQRRPANSTT